MNTRFHTSLVLILALLLLTACAPSFKPPAADAEALVQNIGEALNAGDVDAAMELMADDPVFRTEFFNETYTGAEAVRQLFTDLVAGDFRIQAEVQAVDGNAVTTRTTTWGGGMPPSVEPMVATEVYLIEDGKITSITWTPTEESVAKLQAFMARMQAESIVQGFIEAQNAGDVEGALTFLADEAVIQLVPPPMEGDDGIFTGKEEIRAWYENLASLHGTGELSNVSVAGDQVTAILTYTDDSLKQIDVDSIDNQWVVTIQDGKIQAYTATLTEESLDKLMAAMAAAQAE